MNRTDHERHAVVRELTIAVRLLAAVGAVAICAWIVVGVLWAHAETERIEPVTYPEMELER